MSEILGAQNRKDRKRMIDEPGQINLIGRGALFLCQFCGARPSPLVARILVFAVKKAVRRRTVRRDSQTAVPMLGDGAGRVQVVFA